MFQVKYYARSYGDMSIPRLDDDKGTFKFESCFDDYTVDNFGVKDYTIVNTLGGNVAVLAMFSLLNIIIMYLGIYSIQQVTKAKYPSLDSTSMKIFNDLYWSTACVSAAINTSCFIAE